MLISWSFFNNYKKQEKKKNNLQNIYLDIDQIPIKKDDIQKSENDQKIIIIDLFSDEE